MGIDSWVGGWWFTFQLAYSLPEYCWGWPSNQDPKSAIILHYRTKYSNKYTLKKPKLIRNVFWRLKHFYSNYFFKIHDLKVQRMSIFVWLFWPNWYLIIPRMWHEIALHLSVLIIFAIITFVHHTRYSFCFSSLAWLTLCYPFQTQLWHRCCCSSWMEVSLFSSHRHHHRIFTLHQISDHRYSFSRTNVIYTSALSFVILYWNTG